MIQSFLVTIDDDKITDPAKFPNCDDVEEAVVNAFGVPPSLKVKAEPVRQLYPYEIRSMWVIVK